MNDPNATKSGNCEKVRGKIVSKTGWDVLDEARRLLSTAVAGVPADGWHRPTPCAEWDVTQVLQPASRMSSLAYRAASRTARLPDARGDLLIWDA